MANKAIFSYGDSGKRKIGHSKFDMGFEHLMSANFGGLHPAAVFETLPDDYWDISNNTVTLLKPLTAPAFTRINQNFYGAYVRNQQIWKYWNDFISNGTAFGDVYGNNVTNQSLQNAWEVPSIPTSYLQFIQKVGVGNATPVWSFEVSCNEAGTTGSMFACYLWKNIEFKNIPSSEAVRVTDAVYACLQLPSTVVFPDMHRKVNFLQLSKHGFDVFLAKDGDNVYFRVDLYCSLRQYLTLSSVLIGSGSSFSQPVTSSIGEDIQSSDSLSRSLNRVWFRFFSDNVSPEPKTSTSAFLLEKCNYKGTDGAILKSLDYTPRVVSTAVKVVGHHSVSGTSFYDVYQCIQSPFWGFRYCAYHTTSDLYIRPSRCATPLFNSSLDFYWQIDGSQFGYTTNSDVTPLFESWSEDVHYLGVSVNQMTDSLEDFGSQSNYGTNFGVSFSSTLGPRYTVHSRGFGSTIGTSLNVTHISEIALCDYLLTVNVASGLFVNGLPVASFTSRDSKSLGYDLISMFVYLCNNSVILQDEMGIKVDPLSSRSFWHYRFELTNALPFFAYDKIWNDNFRNSVVSSPSLDWSESNGVMYAPRGFYDYFVFNTRFLEPSQRPTRYAGKVSSDFDANGWTLELCTLPRNAENSHIHTHLPITSFNTVISLLTGFEFEFVFEGLSSTDLNVDDYYLPSYYNGLLHLKFQNFNKDYFTSALLDPMSGANQVSVGSTINELRENEAKQHWWERTAMYRSVKKWFQGTYGITPIELPQDSRITGTDHIDVQIGEVIQTSGSTPESPQGTRSGLGGCRGSGNLCHGHANEHGWIFVLVSHTVESQYLQVYDKMFDVKDSFLDYPTVDFAGIGNESILQKELNYTTVPTSFYDSEFFELSGFANNEVSYLPIDRDASISYRGKSNPFLAKSPSFNSIAGNYNIANAAGTSLDNVFGFIPRYSSYKFKFDQVSGQFRHELNFWHTFKRYLTMPILCHEFVNWEMAADDDDINRIFAVSDDFLDDKFTIDCFINASVDRALPFVCVPMSK